MDRSRKAGNRNQGTGSGKSKNIPSKAPGGSRGSGGPPPLPPPPSDAPRTIPINIPVTNSYSTPTYAPGYAAVPQYATSSNSNYDHSSSGQARPFTARPQQPGPELSSSTSRPHYPEVAPPFYSRTSAAPSRPALGGPGTSSGSLGDDVTSVSGTTNTLGLPSGRLINPTAAQTQFQHLLPTKCREFAALARGRFRTVQTYIRQRPFILEEDPQQFLDEAIRVYAFGDRDYGDRLVQQGVILTELQGLDGEQTPGDYLSELLDEKSDTLGAYYKQFDKAQKEAKDKAKEKAAASRADRQLASGGPAASQQDEPTRSMQSAYPRSQTQPFVSHGSQNTAQSNTTRYPTTQATFSRQSSLPYNAEGFRQDPNQAVDRQDPSVQLQGFEGMNISSSVQIPPATTYPGFSSRQQGNPSMSTSSGNPQAGNDTPQTFDVRGANTVGDPPDTLDRRYFVHDSNFYQPGRVFSVVWHEGLGDTAANAADLSRNSNAYTSAQQPWTVGIHGQKIYSTIRRMVVVRSKRGFSVCIQINTYAGRGLNKFKNSPDDVKAHSIIYMTGTAATYLPSEPVTTKRAIAVDRTKPGTLDKASRLCYSRPHTVEHNVKSMEIGFISQDCLSDVIRYYRESS